MRGSGVDRKSAFIKRFGDLVALLRVDPGNDAAQDLALTAACAAVADTPLEIEAGVEWSEIPPELSLKGRLLSRQVDCIRVAAGAEPHELLALARALAHDVTPIPTTANVRVDMVPLLAPPLPPPGGGPPPSGGPPRHHARRDPPDLRVTSSIANRRLGSERRHWSERRRFRRGYWAGPERRHGVDRRTTGERRIYLINDLRSETTRLHEVLARSTREQQWVQVLHTALELVELQPRVSQADRGMFGIELRRALPRATLAALIRQSESDLPSREPTSTVLQWVGLEAVELVLERLRGGEAPGVRGFLYDVVAGVPSAYPQVAAMLRSSSAHEVRHAAMILGRLGNGEAVALLQPLLSHTDESVRHAAVGALGALHQGAAADGLRLALHHPAARTRAAAADAIAVWRGGALAILLVAALETERDREAWNANVLALGRIGSLEACTALARAAMARRNLLRRRGYSSRQRLAAVSALGLSSSAHAREMLLRLTRENDGIVSPAAGRLLHPQSRQAG
jgi:HEAT repeat protein